MGRQETKQEFLLCMRKVPLGWVDRHLQKINAVCMEGKRRSAHLSMMWELGAYKHWKFDETMKSWARVVLDEKKRALHELGWKNHQKNINRTIQFWTRTVQIYASYKTLQLRVKFVKHEAEQERMWEDQHEWAADRLYSLCTDLGGFFLKSAQLLAKPDLSPMPWVRKLVVLCDGAPETPYKMVQKVIEQEFGKPMDSIFERFDCKPLGSASVAQVHRARVRGATKDVAVKVQHPGAHELMMTDIRNQKMFAAFLQRFDVQFDILSILDELEHQVELEFDFVKEAVSMDQISKSLQSANQGKSPIAVPRSIPGLVTKKVLVMDFIEGVPILKLGDEMAKRGIDPNGAMAKIAKRNILRDLSSAYGQMILRDGFFQADPHPGNVHIMKDGRVALLDYGQVKELSEDLRLGFARLVVALASNNVSEIVSCFKNLGIETVQMGGNDSDSFRTLAVTMFDTKLPPGVAVANPFGEDTVLNDVSVKNFPKDLFFILRTIHILRGLSVGMDCPYSSSEQWKPLAQAILAEDRNLTLNPIPDIPVKVEAKVKELVWERRQRRRRNHN
ncbi:hypothetical protein BDL97_06G066500 [Sphagnum fallax]|nr:hypothetical protein BDL97_06G066500 [Sphagnum fallax]